MTLRSLFLMLCMTMLAMSPAWATTDKHHKTAAKKPAAVKQVAARPAGNPLSNPRFSALIIDAATGQVLQNADADGLRHPASLTKMMTLYLAFQALDAGKLHLEDQLFVSQYASSMSPSKLGLRPGERITAENAILGIVTESANDAAVVMAEALGGGSESRFADRMTQTARQLGMKDTTYRNASGLPNDEQITSARDMAKLALALQRHFPQYYHYFSTPSFTYKGAFHANHNHLMERYEGMDGIKTGYVRASGFNLVASVKRGNKRLIGVIFGGPSAAGRDAQLARMLDVAFASINNGELPRTQTASAEPPVRLNSSAVSAPPITTAMATQARQATPPVVPAAIAAATEQKVDENINANIASRVARLAKPVAQPASETGEGDIDEDAAQTAALNAAQVPAPATSPVVAAVAASLNTPSAVAVQPDPAPVVPAPVAAAVPAAQPAAPKPQPVQVAQNLLPPVVAELQKPAAKPVEAVKPAVEKVVEKPAEKPVVKPANSKAGKNWGIQVGAYNDRASGQRATALVADSMPDILKKADPRVLAVSTSSGTIYRARLIGLDEREARTACTRLSGKGKPCLTLPPNGTTGAWLASADGQ